ncbi:MAG: nickel pincer cofactor biosynthesis protein LarB [Candidatus Anaerobiospirillum merdipullorum]|uniref:Nickel pincer cofactor biosynthesis protein LarB n=1 Tax=Candidatus Anaerobiospirillum merdipullorum TaxID=2838450 RepID=A0A9E2KNX3_9GAMM|nr:nickel pincer cofactor biosynthesis protein LarB [Candidatus Anaerobiospirillum merdipullorum]
MLDVEQVLQAVKDGTMSVATAKAQLQAAPFIDLGFAKLDLHRKVRTGMAEVVFCQSKADDFLVTIFGKLLQADGTALGTRCSTAQAQLLQAHYPQLQYDKLSGVICTPPQDEGKGLIAVVTAGTADAKVAEEAAQVCTYFGGKVARIYDAGVSGLHRLLAHVPLIQQANVIIAIAGMEGALPSVLGGLVSNPVIAVPTSVGYGANFKGLSALLTMINSCANGIGVVNIDNGFGAAYLATQINRLALRNPQESAEEA